MSSLNVDETLDLIEKSLESKIGDKGRLIYIKNSLMNGRKVFEFDKIYLKELREKINPISIENKKSLSLTTRNTKQELDVIKKLLKAEVGNPERLLTIKKEIIEYHEISNENHEYLNEKYDQLVKTDSVEKRVYEDLEIIKKLQEAEIGNSERLESIKNTLLEGFELELQDINYFDEKARALKKLQGYEKISSENKGKVTQSAITKVSFTERDSTLYDLTVTLKIFDIVVWSASISFFLWVLGFAFINLGPIHGHLLGFAVGLGICAGIIRKIQGKLKQVQL